MISRYLGRIDAYLLRAPNAEQPRLAVLFLRAAIEEQRPADAPQHLKALEAFLNLTSAPAAVRKCAAGVRAELVLLNMAEGPRDAVRDLAHLEAFIKKHSTGAELVGLHNQVKSVRAALMGAASEANAGIVGMAARLAKVWEGTAPHPATVSNTTAGAGPCNDCKGTCAKCPYDE